MGTRHNIVFINDKESIKELKNGSISSARLSKNNPCVYVHWDGYPSGALPILIEFLSIAGAQNRICDKEYLAAWYVAYKIITEKGADSENIKNFADFTGIGIEAKLNSWCDFTYIICGDEIYICDYKMKLLCIFNYKEDTIDDIKYCEWYY